jgi:hypothetical protein
VSVGYLISKIPTIIEHIARKIELCRTFIFSFIKRL